jgi:hypothetical protein
LMLCTVPFKLLRGGGQVDVITDHSARFGWVDSALFLRHSDVALC